MTPPTGIPQWLEQFLYSQGGMEGLLYQVGGMQGLLDLIQQQSQPPTPNSPLQQRRDAGSALEQQWRSFLPPPPSVTTTPSQREAAYRATPQYQSLLTGQTPAGTSLGPNWRPNNNIYLNQPDYNQYLNWTPDQGLNALPTQLRPTGDPQATIDAYNTADAAYRANPNDPALKQAAVQAAEALRVATQGPAGRGSLAPTGSTGLPVGNTTGLPTGSWPNVFLDKPRTDTADPLSKYDYAAKYGYGGASGVAPDFQRVQATLRAAGWDPSEGYAPRTDWGTPSTLDSVNTNRAQMLNELLYSITPRNPPSGERTVRPPSLPQAPDPFAGMQSAINRDAYVNDTLGGGFYGGLIPDQDAVQTWGYRQIGGAQDPHFPTPQLAMNPLPGQSKYDTYAGWAADQGAAFGTAPWAVDSKWGQAMGYDDSRVYQQPPPPPTAWQPTPQFGGTQGWGNTSRNGQNNNAWGNSSSTQQQPMTFGTSPWDNPWGMR